MLFQNKDIRYMNKDEKQQKANIDEFLANNPEIEELSARLSTFNVFHTLKIEKAEIRYSNVLAWLLNPDESHNMGDVFLRRIISNILLEGDIDKEEISAAQVELYDFSNIDVRREWKNIDLLVIDHNNKAVILFENKIGSKETEDQLEKYLKIVREEFPSFIPVPVCLTLMGDEPSDKNKGKYYNYSYIQLLSVIERICSQRKNQMPSPISLFIEQFMEVLRRLTMQDENLVNLCKTIYRKHRNAIDMIVEYGMVSAGQQVAEDILSEDGDYEILFSSASLVRFLPRGWSSIIPENGTAWNNLKRSVSVVCFFKFSSNKNSIKLIFEVSSMKDTQLRLNCVNKLRDKGFKLTKSAFREDAKYSRFYSDMVKISDLTDIETVNITVRKLLKKAKYEFPKAEEVFQEVFMIK